MPFISLCLVDRKQYGIAFSVDTSSICTVTIPRSGLAGLLIAAFADFPMEIADDECHEVQVQLDALGRVREVVEAFVSLLDAIRGTLFGRQPTFKNDFKVLVFRLKLAGQSIKLCVSGSKIMFVVRRNDPGTDLLSSLAKDSTRSRFVCDECQSFDPDLPPGGSRDARNGVDDLRVSAERVAVGADLPINAIGENRG
jgi:hypothetical protein